MRTSVGSIHPTGMSTDTINGVQSFPERAHTHTAPLGSFTQPAHAYA